MVSSGSIFPLLHICLRLPALGPESLSYARSLEFSICPPILYPVAAYFHSYCWYSGFLSCLSHTCSCPLFLFFYPVPQNSLLQHSMSLLFPILSEIEGSTLGDSFLFNFLESVEYIMGVLYFLDNMHLSVNIYHICLWVWVTSTQNNIFYFHPFACKIYDVFVSHS